MGTDMAHHSIGSILASDIIRGETKMMITERLQEADKTWNSGILSQTIIELINEYPELNLLDIEDELRKFSRTTYLVAWPKDQCSFIINGRNVFPRNIKLEPVDYALWVCVNGPNDMIETVERFGLTIKQNREALRMAGFNMMDPEDVCSRTEA